MNLPTSQDIETADRLRLSYAQLQREIAKTIIGQHEVVKLLLLSTFCRGHALLVGVPGLAKTLLVKTIAEALDLGFKRIQFTPDLMPSDITGSEMMDRDRNFQFIKGPVFTNIVLADEINRTPPKTQSALLETMQEHSVTVGGQSYPIGEPFFVFATQNPIEQEGTYPLPEAQLDRFMFNVQLDYPSYDQEINILKTQASNNLEEVGKVINGNEILQFQDLVRRVPVAENVLEYIVKLVRSTRPGPSGSSIANQFLEWGAGPRASQFLLLGAQCHALIRGMYSPDIDDVRLLAAPILRHRMVRNFKAETDGLTVDSLIEQLLML